MSEQGLYRMVSEVEIASLSKYFLGRDSQGFYCYLLEKSSGNHESFEADRYADNNFFGWCPHNFFPKALFFDMDGTVIEQESIVELANLVGKRDEVHEVTELAMSGRLDFVEALRERVKVLSGLSVEQIKLVGERLTVFKGVKATLNYARECGIPAYLVSGGFLELAEPLAQHLGFAGCHANGLEVEHGSLTGALAGRIVDSQEKARWMQEICRSLHCEPSQVAAIGDGANDIPMLKQSGCAVAFKGKAALRGHVHCWNPTGTHEAMLSLLMAKSPFVREL